MTFIFLIKGDTLRRLEPTANVNNTAGYRRLSIGKDEIDTDQNAIPTRSNARSHNDFHNIVINYFADANSVEELYKILLEYAGIKLSVTSSIEPLFEKLGQTVFALAQIKKFEVKILPNVLINDSQSVALNPSIELSILNLINLNIQSVCKQSREQNQLHSANVQTGIRVQSIKQEVDLSLLRLVYQFYTVIANTFEYIDMDEVTKPDTNPFQALDGNSVIRSRATTLISQHEYDIGRISRKSRANILHLDNNDTIDAELPCWKKLRELISLHDMPTDIKHLSVPSKEERNHSQISNDDSLEEHKNGSFTLPQKQNEIKNDTLLLSAFGWLIIDDIYYAASLGSLKVDGCMRKVQGSMSLSQRLRNLPTNTNNQNPKK